MPFHDPGFVVTIVLVCTLGWIANNWIRARHGYPLEDQWGGFLGLKEKGIHPSLPLDNAENRRLKAENKALHDKLDAMQDRLVVLETIVTDRGYGLAAEIEALREDRGVPLGLDKKERA
jgi:hypothetical protein